jgi:hypothetical protein
MTGILEARMFRSVPGGYIFQPPPLTIFSPVDSYLVNESQKADVLAIIRSRTAVWIRIVADSALALAVATGVAIDGVGGAPPIVSISSAFCIFLIVQMSGSALAIYVTLRRLKPILAGLPRSNVPSPDRRQFPFGRPSPAFATFWSVVLALYIGYEHHSLNDILFIVLFIGLVLAFSLRRPKSPQAGGGAGTDRSS